MSPYAPRLLLAVVLALAAAAAAILVADPGPRTGDDQRAGEFHRLVGGLGFGPATHLAHCPFSFDPRLCPECPYDRGPLPGGRRLCPEHGTSILYYLPLPPEAPAGHARRP